MWMNRRFMSRTRDRPKSAEGRLDVIQGAERHNRPRFRAKPWTQVIVLRVSGCFRESGEEQPGIFVFTVHELRVPLDSPEEMSGRCIKRLHKTVI